MSVPAAFLGVILIWATTPLGIKWSGEGVGFLFGVAGRMAIGLVACLLLVALLSRRMRWHRRARQTYLVAGIGIWAAMSSVYWAAQHIPSGLISVVFGLTPVVTGALAAVWLREHAFTPFRVGGMLLGACGLVVIFGQLPALGVHAVVGVSGVLLAVIVHSLSAVWVKRLDVPMHPLETTTGSLIVAVPLFLVTWAVLDGQWPAVLPRRALGAIVYLALFGSVLGFVLYFYLLRHSQASRVALITLVTPVLALLLGQFLNHEAVGTRVWFGTVVILLGLASYQWGDQWRMQRLRAD
ncbi:MAG: DMT family transporter [Gammaproteobacteria bacterium]|nr:DMT family transporter [Gammaproteobacteria bacterium]